jgi:N4-gp56 family major capsid protein
MRNILSFLTDALFSFLGFGADVVTVTSGTAGNAGSTAAELITYMSARMLEVAEFNTILDQFGDKHPLPSNSSKTIRFTREEKLSVAASPTQLTEGLPPDAVGLTINQVEATIEQYGQVVRLSDLAEITARHNVIERTIYVLGLQAAETYDQLIFNVLDAATNNYRPNSRANDTSLNGADLVQYPDLVELDAVLQDNGARPFEGGEYVFVTPPQVYAGFLRDPDYKASNQFKSPEKIWRGEVGSLGGFRLIRTNSPSFAATSQAGAGQSSKVFSSFAIGRFAYQITDLQNLRVYVVAPGGQVDPLQQSRKIGWKFAFKSVITNQTWLRRVRSAGANSITN